jgi:NADH dehydrogenase
VLPKDYPDLDIRRMSVHLIQADDRLLPGMSIKSSRAAEEFLTKMGVHVWTNTFVKDYNGQSVFTGDQTIPASTVIWAAGVAGNFPSGLPEESVHKGRIRVDDLNQVMGVEGIYALGDVALMESVNEGKGHPMVAQVAIQQADNLGKNLAKTTNIEGWKSFTYIDKGSMATIGRNRAVVDIGKFHSHGTFAWVLWMLVHLMALVGFKNRLVALTNWTVSYWSYDKGIRLIIRPFSRHNHMESVG